jgi:hypothetical protein
MLVETLMKSVWKAIADDHSLRVFSLQDAAASPRIYPNMILSLTDNACLYDGKLPQALMEAAPYIVHLSGSSAYTPWLLNEGWGNNWGILLQSTANLMSLRAHFQRLLIVKDEGGRRFNFRYYDPRVIRSYLPTCKPAELRMLFGPVDKFFVQSQKENELLVFSLKADKLVTELIPVGRLPSPALETVTAIPVSQK